MARGDGFRYKSKDIASILMSDMGGSMDFNDSSHLGSSYLVSRSYNLTDE